ncbi:Na+/H+ antiporter subunit D [Allonocardiopsis opalescens]|uniref:Multisubunit sodium/proton antiporter MrpD subunit n=1 Tax=Allonocardiopsis opalescens TaxID=1144618 RepID=A0A2T0Q0M2_9ACTN|nr:Na+/H+ antiporter subunit D [Allonocardiopsis opalescens]PRX97339.1 multisubunit sodium/proton antiporter MrpD subunit [Allonocardiopsis opalescens]
MTVLVALPFLLPLLGAAVTLLISRWPRVQRAASLLTLAAVTANAGLLLAETADGTVISSQAGGWPAPLGITLVADPLSALLVLVSSVVLLIVLLYAIGQDVGGLSRGNPDVFHPVYLVLTAGVGLSFVAGDLFNLFVGFEVTLTASYALITQAPTRERTRASMIYTVVSLISSILFLTGIALVYAATGTVNMADIADRLATVPGDLRNVLGLFFLVVFGIKAAVVPMHFWLPDSYPIAITRISAIFAALLTKVAVYAIIRTQTLLFSRDDITDVLLVFAIVTMLVGILGALVQDDVNRVLSFALVSHIGYMIFGLGLVGVPGGHDDAGVAGLTGVIVYLVHHIVVQATLFLVAGLIRQYVGNTSLRSIRGLASVSPALALFFFLPAMSLAGLPPMSGFVAKLALFQAGLEQGGPLAYAGVAAGVATSVLTLIAIFRIWVRGFWGTPSQAIVAAQSALSSGTGRFGIRWMTATTGLMVATGIAVALLAGPLTEIGTVAARELISGEAYRTAVMSDSVVAP